MYQNVSSSSFIFLLFPAVPNFVRRFMLAKVDFYPTDPVKIMMELETGATQN